ncbi:MAG: hypothetical protein L6R48_03820 [Planctomycetes bacterium]|nr:hypothetical protein [Planctomycetota bacterium]
MPIARLALLAAMLLSAGLATTLHAVESKPAASTLLATPASSIQTPAGDRETPAADAQLPEVMVIKAGGGGVISLRPDSPSLLNGGVDLQYGGVRVRCETLVATRAPYPGCGDAERRSRHTAVAFGEPAGQGADA